MMKTCACLLVWVMAVVSVLMQLPGAAAPPQESLWLSEWSFEVNLSPFRPYSGSGYNTCIAYCSHTQLLRPCPSDVPLRAVLSFSGLPVVYLVQPTPLCRGQLGSIPRHLLWRVTTEHLRRRWLGSVPGCLPQQVAPL
jgi:hypothetical protein